MTGRDFGSLFSKDMDLPSSTWPAPAQTLTTVLVQRLTTRDTPIDRILTKVHVFKIFYFHLQRISWFNISRLETKKVQLHYIPKKTTSLTSLGRKNLKWHHLVLSKMILPPNHIAGPKWKKLSDPMPHCYTPGLLWALAQKNLVPQLPIDDPMAAWRLVMVFLWFLLLIQRIKEKNKSNPFCIVGINWSVGVSNLLFI